MNKEELEAIKLLAKGRGWSVSDYLRFKADLIPSKVSRYD